jgi:hypothetical protein
MGLFNLASSSIAFGSRLVGMVPELPRGLLRATVVRKKYNDYQMNHKRGSITIELDEEFLMHS